jgi:hypothetical protein
MPVIDQVDLPAMRCELTQEYNGGTVTLGGLIMSPVEVNGQYQLVVIKAGPAGSSSIRQGGQFSASAGAPVAVGKAKLSLEPGATYTTRLLVQAGGRSYECHGENGVGGSE